MTRADLETRARDLYTEARAADPYHVDAIVESLLGREVWAWSSLPCRTLRGLCLALAPSIMRARG